MGNTDSNEEPQYDSSSINEPNLCIFDESYLTHDISDNPKRQKFENNLTILLLIESFGTHTWIGSKKKKDIDFNTLITREKLINHIQKMSMPDSLVPWLKENMQDQLLKVIKYPIFFSRDFTKKFKDNKEFYNEYIKDINKLFVNEGYDLLCEETKTRFCESLFLYINPLYYCELDTKSEEEIDEFFNDYAMKQLKKRYNNKNIFGFVANNPTRENKIEFLLSFDKSDFRNCISQENQKKIQTMFLNKISSNKDILLKCINNLEEKSYEHMFLYFKLFTNIGRKDKNYEKKFQKIEELHYQKFYDTITPEEEKEYTYYLNFEDHWKLFDMDEEKYMEIVLWTMILDDYSFCEYHHDEHPYLQNYNENVKQNIINKINSDNNYVVENRYGKIHTLDDAVDISVFIQDPPSFLKSKDLEYYTEYNNVLYDILNKFNYDMNKLLYRKMKLITKYEIVEE